jgi:DNA-binding IclR family transcriptional regulator
VTNRAKLEKQLLEISRQGYAVVHEEFEIVLSAVAVPIYKHNGNVIASVSISGPAFRFTPEEDPGLIEGLCAAGLSISAKMGYRVR